MIRKSKADPGRPVPPPELLRHGPDWSLAEYEAWFNARINWAKANDDSAALGPTPDGPFDYDAI